MSRSNPMLNKHGRSNMRIGFKVFPPRLSKSLNQSLPFSAAVQLHAVRSAGNIQMSVLRLGGQGGGIWLPGKRRFVYYCASNQLNENHTGSQPDDAESRTCCCRANVAREQACRRSD